MVGEKGTQIWYKSENCRVFCMLNFCFNPSPDNTISDESKLKEFADDNLNTNKRLKFTLKRVENIVGKGEMLVTSHFLLFPQCFQKASSVGSLKVETMWQSVKKHDKKR